MIKRFFVGLMVGAMLAGGSALAHVEELVEEVSGRVEVWDPENGLISLSGVPYTLAPGFSVQDRSGEALAQPPQVGQRVSVKRQGNTVFEIVIDVSPQGKRQ